MMHKSDLDGPDDTGTDDDYGHPDDTGERFILFFALMVFLFLLLIILDKNGLEKSDFS